MMVTFRNLVLLVLLHSASLIGISQITIEPYSKQLTWSVDALTSLPSPKAQFEGQSIIPTYTDQIFSGGCLGTLVRTYTYKEPNGETATAEVYVLLTDDTPPVLLGVPTDVVLRDKQIPKAAVVTATDNSGITPEVRMSETMEKNMIIREWTATDDCGNTTSARQRLRLNIK